MELRYFYSLSYNFSYTLCGNLNFTSLQAHMITKYGYGTVIAVLFISFGLAIFGHFTKEAFPVIAYSALGLAIVLIVFTLQFFRDPDRTPKERDGVVISPADGKVVLIKSIESHPYFNGPATMVSIFMSPINVHVNRFPIDGTVDHMTYIEGQFIAAFDHDAGERNERTEIGISNGNTRVFFKQISGFVARRIVCPLTIGDKATLGERFGMIRFGSRVDLFLPPDMSLSVKLGDTTAAGETVVARFTTA